MDLGPVRFCPGSEIICTDPAPDPSINTEKIKKNLYSYCFVTSLWLFIFEKWCKNSRVSDPHWFNADPDTHPDPAFFLIADPDPNPQFTAGNYIYFFLSKIAIYRYLSLGLHKRRPSYRRSFQPSKENIQHFKTWKFCVFFLFLCVIFALLDPDPEFECGSGSGNSELMRIRIRNPEKFLQEVVIKQIITNYFLFPSWMSLTKIAGSGAGDGCRRYESADPEQNVTDPQHWYLLNSHLGQLETIDSSVADPYMGKIQCSVPVTIWYETRSADPSNWTIPLTNGSGSAWPSYFLISCYYPLV